MNRAFAAIAVLLACNSTPGTDAGVDSGTLSDSAATDSPILGDAAIDAGSEASNCTLTHPPTSSTCATCMQANCCAAANSCATNPDCASYMACARACAPPDAGADAAPDAQTTADSGEGSGFACFKACQMQFPNGVNDGIVVVECEDITCAGQACP